MGFKDLFKKKEQLKETSAMKEINSRLRIV